MLVSFRRARWACMVALTFTGLSAGMLVWAGTALLAVGMMEPAYATFGMAAIALFMVGLISPRTVVDRVLDEGQD